MSELSGMQDVSFGIVLPVILRQLAVAALSSGVLCIKLSTRDKLAYFGSVER